MRVTIVIILLIVSLSTYLLVSYSRNDFDLGDKENIQIFIEKVDNNTMIIPDEKEINYFETEKDVNNWFVFINGKRDKEDKILKRVEKHAAKGDYSMKISLPLNKSIELVLVHFTEDWISFKYLNFDIYNPSKDETQLNLKIGDYFDASAFYPASQKFKEKFKLRQGLNNIKIRVSDITDKIKIKSERKTIHFCFLAKDNLDLYLDNMKLKK